jgi:uncharacterized protein (DUF362 family)
MEEIIFTPEMRETRRKFMQKSMLIAGGAGMLAGCGASLPTGMAPIHRNLVLPAERRPARRGGTTALSFTTGRDTRQTTIDVLQPLTDTIARDSAGKQVIIKPNVGHTGSNHSHEVTDVDQLRGILDVIAPLTDRPIIIAEGTASAAVSVQAGYETFGYTALEREYGVRLLDANDSDTTLLWILAGYLRPQPINIINLYLDPNVYLVSACRMKTSGGVVATLSIKNIAMGAPKSHYTLNKTGKELTGGSPINEKAKMHGGIGSAHGRELTYNIFTLASRGVCADLAVLDGVVGADGNGPWAADPIEHGVAVASNDPVAADRLASGLMGIDYDYMLYVQWCAQAGVGIDDFSQVSYHGPDWRPHIKKYRLNRTWESQVRWIRDLREQISS